jgi:hypothetical protein
MYRDLILVAVSSLTFILIIIPWLPGALWWLATKLIRYDAYLNFITKFWENLK